MKLTTLKPRIQSMPRAAVSVVSTDSWRAGKETSNQRGYTYKWQQAREGYLAKHPWCVYCLRKLGVTTADPLEQQEQSIARGQYPTPATVLDHKVPHRGDMVRFWDTSNWAGLCAHCHSGEKQREEAAAGYGDTHRAGR
jgi:5-methylcytosine-specific restriction protein A